MGRESLAGKGRGKWCPRRGAEWPAAVLAKTAVLGNSIGMPLGTSELQPNHRQVWRAKESKSL